MVCPYPPGIPLLVPGEMLDEARVDWLIEQKAPKTNQYLLKKIEKLKKDYGVIN